MQIKCIRGGGDKPADPIIDNLCCSLPAMLARGRVELDLGMGFYPAQQSVVHLQDVEVGDLITSSDRFSGIPFRGVINSVEYGLDSSGMPLISLGISRECD